MTPVAPRVEVSVGLSTGDAALRQLVADRFASRLFARDATLWGEAAQSEASVRLGWVDAHVRGEAVTAEAEALRAELAQQGVDRVILCGMGGSSLAPEVIAARSHAPLIVLDSTHPDQVRAALQDLERTAVVVSSKSGSTVETRSQLAACEAAFGEAGIAPSERIIVVTDPGSALQADAAVRGYRTFLADPEVGGRYSALTAFGIVPSVLVGADMRAVLAEASSAAGILSSDEMSNPALQLAAALAAALPQRYLCGVYTRSAGEVDAAAPPLADWIEQLVAESTGKDGRGVLPISLDPSAPELNGRLPASELLVELRDGSTNVEDPAWNTGEPTIIVSGSLGAQFLLWEVATAALGRLIEVNPFDQPDVEAAKVAARAVLARGARGGPSAGGVLSASEPLVWLTDAASADGYLVIQAYLDRFAEAPLVRLRAALATALGVPVALGFGPRYLHSTGQFHKGGPARGVFLQILDDTVADQPIPGEPGGFAALISAQAAGDRDVLAAQGRPVLTTTVAGVAPLLAAAESATR